jgi:hypothetical protein
MNFSITTGFTIAVGMLIVSCGEMTTQNNQATHDTTSSVDMAEVAIIKPSIANPDAALTAQTQNIFSDYLQMQSALARDQFKEAAIAAKHLNTVMDSFKDSTLPENQKQAYQNHINAIKEGAAGIANSKNIEQQRIAFEPLSVHVFDLLKSFGSSKPVYETHCPMAFDNKGASWLSDQTAIRNPYFGSKMLECGEVVSMIKK